MSASPEGPAGHHARWEARGFAREAVHPLAPPGAALAPTFALDPKHLGKAPAMRRPDGLWRGLNHLHEPSPDAATCDLWGANLGVKGVAFPALDFDVGDAETVRALVALTRGRLGFSPPRVGRSPRVLLPFRRCPADVAEGIAMPKRALRFTLRGEPMAVELIGERQQWAAAGMHPRGTPYAWPEGEPRAEELPLLTRAAADSLFLALADALDMLGAADVRHEGAREEGPKPDATALLAPPDVDLAAAVAAMPMARDRDDWIAKGMAIKGAGGSLEHWAEWSRKWGEEDDADLARRWAGFAADRAGWPQIERAATAGGWLGGAERDFAGVPAPSALPRRRRLRVLTMAECASEPPPRYLWKGVCSRGDFAILYGPPGSGKSALAPRIAYAVAAGLPLFGRRTRQARVLYVAAENGGGLTTRVCAVKKVHGSVDGFFVAPDSVNLLHKPDRAELAAVIQEQDIGLVVLDTLAAAFPGLRENDSDAMGEAVGIIRRLTEANGAAVIVVHHGAKSGDRGPRGHGLLNGAADVTMEVFPPEAGSGPRRVILGKNRNGPSDLTFAFDVVAEEVGTDEDGGAVTAAMAREAEASPARGPRLPPSAKRALAMLDAVLARGGAALPTGPGFPPEGWPGTGKDAWRRECEAAGLSSAEKPSARTGVFNTAVRELRAAGLIEEREGFVWKL